MLSEPWKKDRFEAFVTLALSIVLSHTLRKRQENGKLRGSTPDESADEAVAGD